MTAIEPLDEPQREVVYVAVEGRAWHIVKQWQVNTNGFNSSALTMCNRWIIPEYESGRAFGPECKRCARGR